MAKKVTQYSVFLGSPGDLGIERKEVENVVNELNLTYGKRNSIVLDLIKWETHSAPGISHDYSQAIINEDVGDDFDIFIGLIWMKFGTPTDVANSGTEEEFERVLKRFKKGENIQIMFYFKTTPPSNINEIDLEEFAKIKKFKQRLKDEKVLYKDFDTIDNLMTYLRLHLPKRIDNLIENISSMETLSTEILELNEEVEEEIEELGYVDYVIDFADYLNYSNTALRNISEATEIVGKEIEKKAEEMIRISKFPNPNKNMIIEAFKRTAKVLNDYSDRLKLETPNFYDNFEVAINSGLQYINSINSSNVDNHLNNLDEAFASATSLKKNIPTATMGMTSFKSSVETMPNIQSDLNRSRRILLKQLEDLIIRLNKAYELTNDFQGQVEYKIDLFKDSTRE